MLRVVTEGNKGGSLLHSFGLVQLRDERRAFVNTEHAQKCFADAGNFDQKTPNDKIKRYSTQTCFRTSQLHLSRLHHHARRAALAHGASVRRAEAGSDCQQVARSCARAARDGGFDESAGFSSRS